MRHGNTLWTLTALMTLCATVNCGNNQRGGPLSSASSVGSEVIAYCRYDPMTGSSEIFSISTDGTNDKKLITASIGLNHHEWSPNGNKMACVGYVNSQTWSIYVFDSDGSNLTRLTDTSGVFDGALAWSPDGSKILFTRNPYNGDDLWIMNADGSSQRSLGIKGLQPNWSPNGTRLVYAANKTGSYEIYTSNIDGTDEQRLTNHGATDISPVWSPDGTQIAFASDRDGNSEIYVMKADGTQLRRITNNSVYDGIPKWSPDGTMIAINSNQAGNDHTEVYLMNADGTSMRRLTNTPGSSMGVNPAWSPVGSPARVVGYSPSVADHFTLFQNYPNPFNPTTTIQFDLTQPSQVQLDVYDSLGRTVRTLVDHRKESGRYSVPWDGTDSNGDRVPSGVYVFRLTSGKTTQQQKALLLK